MHRTYVRRRLVLLLAALGLVAVLAGPVSGAMGLAGAAVTPVADRTYTVESGDTLWAIATQIAGDRDPRRVVEQLQAANGIRAGSLQPGMVLRIPAAR